MRGGRSGRGEGHSLGPRKRSSGDASLDDEGDLKSTADSPMKTDQIEIEEEDDNDSNTNTRRKLSLGDEGRKEKKLMVTRSLLALLYHHRHPHM
jgi:hypothetical protein